MYHIGNYEGSGKWTALAGFESLQAYIDNLNNADGSSLEELGEKALSLISTASKCATGTVRNGRAEFTDLMEGLYLLVPENAENAAKTKEYSFLPTVIPLPFSDSEGRLTVKSIEVNLKPGEKQLTGSIRIIKNIIGWNNLLTSTTAVFKVTGRDGNNEIVYSNVFSLQFTAPGTKSFLIDNLPAGITFTVEEVYDGVAYSPDAHPVQVQEVKAGETAVFEFTNTYDGGMVDSVSVENHYYKDESGNPNFRQLEDSTKEGSV